MTNRILILPISALIIAGLCGYKLSRPKDESRRNQPVVIKRPAPLFELHNQGKPPQIVRLKSYRGRHRIVLVFFDPDRKLAGFPVFVWLKEHAEELESQGVEVFAISTALPQTHRKMLKEFSGENDPAPFQMLSDLNENVHRLYGRYDARDSKDRPAVFLIDRAGRLAWDRENPLPLDDPLAELKREFGTE